MRYQKELAAWEEENASPLDSYAESPIPGQANDNGNIDANEYFGRWDSDAGTSPVVQGQYLGLNHMDYDTSSREQN